MSTAEPLCLTVALQLRADAVDVATEHLRQLAEHSRREPGCLGYNVHQSVNDPRQVMIYELYRDDAALEAHRATPHFERHAAHGVHQLVESRTAAVYAPLAVACVKER